VSEIYASTAQVAHRPANERLMALARERALDPSVFDEHKPVFFAAEISNNSLDAYYTRMAVSTLKNFAAESAAGVSVQNSHRTDDIGIGYSLTGVYDEANKRTLAEAFTIPGLPDTGPFITKLRAGIARDVSVGFHPGEDGFFRCDVCDAELFDEDCRHIPGFKYGKEEKRVATATVEGNHLSEWSPVYDGATRGCNIVKAMQEMEAGRLTPKLARILEQRYRIKLPGAVNHFAGTGEGTMTTKRDAGTPAPVKKKPEDEPEEETADDATDDAAEGEESNAAAPEAEATEESREGKKLLSRAGLKVQAPTFKSAAQKLAAECERLRPLADAGTRYTERLQEKVIQEQVRAVGRASESFKAMVSRASDTELVGLLEDLGAKGDEVFRGGRQTEDRAERPEDKQAVTKVPTPLGAYA
jgi:hypothetical protein